MPSTRAALGIAIAVLGASFAGIRAQSPTPTEGTAVIVGHVFGQNGEPLLGAEVWATAPDTPDVVVRRARTDGEGMFVLSRLQSNALTVRARAPGLTTASVDTWTLANTPQIAVDLRLWEARTLRGRILDPDDRPIAGASVIATKDFSLPVEPAEGSTDAAGRFELPGVPIGECVLRAIAPGFAFNGHVFWDVIDEQVDLRLDRHDGVQLRIKVEGLPQQALAATPVRLQAMAGGAYAMPRLVEQQRLAADGTCTVRGLAETEWGITLRHPGFRFVPPFTRVPRSKTPDLVRIFAVPIEPVEMYGQLLADRRPLAGQRVLLHAGTWIEPIAPLMCVTDEEGLFEFSARLPVGARFHLQIAGGDWVVDQAKPRGTLGSYDLCLLGHYEDTAPPDAEMLITAVRATPLRGKVVDARGYPVSFVAVELQQGMKLTRPADTVFWRPGLRTTSGSDGSFAFSGLPASAIPVRIQALGSDAIGITEPFEVQAGPAIEKNVTTRATGRVEGRLIDADGEAVAGECMQLAGENNTRVMTDHRGRFVFPGLAPGIYRLSAMREGRLQPGGPDEFEVRSGETMRRELTWQ